MENEMIMTEEVATVDPEVYVGEVVEEENDHRVGIGFLLGSAVTAGVIIGFTKGKQVVSNLKAKRAAKKAEKEQAKEQIDTELESDEE